MLALVIALMPLLNAYAFAITSSTTAIMALLALSGVTLMTANIPDSVAQNMYRDISTIATDTSHALYSTANTILDFTADYSTKVANATGEMITVTGINLSNAINSFKNYLTYKNVNSAFEGITISNSSNRLNLQKMATLNTGVSLSASHSNIKGATNEVLMNYFNNHLADFPLSNIVLHSTKSFYDATVSGFRTNYPEFRQLYSKQYDDYSGMVALCNTVYGWLTGTFSSYTESVTFNDIYLTVGDELTKCSVEFISFLLKDGLMWFSFVRNASGTIIAHYSTDGTIRNNQTWSQLSFTALPYAYFLATPSGSASPRIGFVIPVGSTSSTNDIRIATGTPSYSTVVDGTKTTLSNTVSFTDTVPFSSSAVSIPRVTGSAVGQDVYGVPDIPESVISGQYNPEVADKIGAVVGGADVIGLNVPVDTGADVYNPSIDAVIGSGTLTSDVVIDGTTVATGTDVITGVQTAVGDLVSTGDTVLDLDTTPGTPGGTPSFPDIFPGLWDWVNGLVDNALQWFIFCGDVFGALPGAIKYTFLGGMTTILAVGVIKKLLF